MPASSGAITISGSAVVIQWARIFMPSISASGCGASTSCSSEPSSISLLNIASSASSIASSTVTSTTPPAIRCSRVSSGPSANGNSIVTISAYSTGIAISPRRRHDSVRSRRSMAAQAVGRLARLMQ